MKAMIAMGVSLGIVGLLFTIYCNVQLKTAKCQTYSVDHTEKIKEVDYVIVPGCLVYKSGKPSYALEDRLNGALRLYQEKKVQKIILSGAARENKTGKIFLTNRNVAEEDILIDDGGLDTYSTIYRCKEAFPNKRFIVCTQQKYFKRTGYLISKLGMKSLSKGVKVDVLDGIVTVTLALNMSYGYSIKDITAKVQEKVKAAIENMTGLEVADVNIRVAGVDVPEEA